MSLNEVQKKIGQLMVFGFNGKKVTPQIRKLIREHHVGGIILFNRNIGTPQEVLSLTTELQREAKDAGHEHPLLICLDQENGIVRRLGEGATVLPGAMLLGATGKSENAYITGLATGRELKALGINWNLAPVLDVNNNPKNPVIGVRSFGETAELVSEFGRQAMKGMQEAGIMTTLKHFPGHGDTNVDSHLDLPTIAHNMDRLERVELKPFADCIEDGADIIMSAHVYFPAIETREGVPATLSKNVITKLLREKMGFKGVVTTDCMEMHAISKTIGTAKGGVEALKAGIDLIMVSHTHPVQHDTLNEIEEAVQNGYINEDVLQDAYDRVMNLKENYLSWDNLSLEGPLTISSEFGSEKHRKDASDIYKQGITIVKNEHDILPLNEEKDQKVLVVYPKNSHVLVVEDGRSDASSLGTIIKQIDEHTTIKELSNPPTKEEIVEIGKLAKDFDAIIVGTLSVQPNDQQVGLVEEIVKNNENVIVVASRSPYDIAYLPNAIKAYINTYEFTHPALTITAKAIFGKLNVTGTLPVTLPEK